MNYHRKRHNEKTPHHEGFLSWAEPGLNRRHMDFQSDFTTPVQPEKTNIHGFFSDTLLVTIWWIMVHFGLLGCTGVAP
jgi:hypothetical protein